MKINKKFKKIGILASIILGTILAIYLIINSIIIFLYYNPSEFSLTFLANNQYARNFIENHYNNVAYKYAREVPKHIKDYEKQREVLKWFRYHPVVLSERAIASVRLKQWGTAIEDLEEAKRQIHTHTVFENEENYLGGIYITLGNLYLKKDNEYMAKTNYEMALNFYENSDIKFDKNESTCQSKSNRALLKLELIKLPSYTSSAYYYKENELLFYAKFYDLVDAMLNDIYDSHIKRLEYARCPQMCIDEAIELKEQRRKYYYREFVPCINTLQMIICYT